MKREDNSLDSPFERAARAIVDKANWANLMNILRHGGINARPMKVWR